MGRTCCSPAQKAHSVRQLHNIRGHQEDKENLVPYPGSPIPRRSHPPTPLATAALSTLHAHPNARRAQNEMKAKLAFSEQKLADVKCELCNAWR